MSRDVKGRIQLRLRSRILVLAQSRLSTLGQLSSPLHHQVFLPVTRMRENIGNTLLLGLRGSAEQESCIRHRGRVLALGAAAVQSKVSGPQPCGLGSDLTARRWGRGPSSHWSVCSQPFQRTPASWRRWAQTSCTPTRLQGSPVWSQLITDFSVTAFLMYSLFVNYIMMLISQLGTLLREAVFSGWPILKDKGGKK